METVEFTRVQDDQTGIVETADYHGHTAVVKLLAHDGFTQVVVEVDGKVVREWFSEEEPLDQTLETAQTTAVNHMQ